MKSIRKSNKTKRNPIINTLVCCLRKMDFTSLSVLVIIVTFMLLLASSSKINGFIETIKVINNINESSRVDYEIIVENVDKKTMINTIINIDDENIDLIITKNSDKYTVVKYR